MSDIRVLVVEDEPVASAAHAAYVGRMAGFTLAGTAPDGQSALRLLTELSASGEPVELVLLDMNLPDLHGLDIARRMRSAGILADIIAITAVREVAIVRSAVAIGVVQYLIKPFTYATFADKLHQLPALPAAADGAGVRGAADRCVPERGGPGVREPAGAVGTAPAERPVRFHARSVKEYLKQQSAPVSATEVMTALGMSRVTARRYLEYLADAGTVTRAPRYGTPGRPENEYGWNRA